MNSWLKDNNWQHFVVLGKQEKTGNKSPIRYSVRFLVISFLISGFGGVAGLVAAQKTSDKQVGNSEPILLAQSSLTIRNKKAAVSLDDALSEDDEEDERLLEEKFDVRRKKRLDPKKWYLKFSLMANYFNLGSDVNNLLDKVEGQFSGDTIDTQLLVLNPRFSLKTADPVSRAGTNIVPTGNVGLGYIMGNHQFEVDFGLAGLVTLNTINTSTTMTLTESNVCTPAQSDQGLCPMADLGFVNRDTGKGKYDFAINMNENVWMLTPSVYYDHVLMREKWGRLSVGGSVGLVIMSLRQEVRFKGTRTDAEETGDDTVDAYNQRTIQGTAVSSASHDVGPIFRLYAGYRRPLTKGILNEIRIGVNYGWVTLDRNMDGTGSADVGAGSENPLRASFPLSQLGFANKEATRFELMGFFIHAGIVF